MNRTPAAFHAPEDQRPRARRSSALQHGLRMVLSLSLALLLIGFALPRLVGTTFTQVVRALELVTAPDAVVLVLLWALGLYVCSFVLTACLDGLGRRRALTLNLTGSAVANVLPFGGAAGMSLNFVMLRAWGYSAREFSSFTLITNLWGILLKLALPAVALAGLVATGDAVSASMRWTALGAAIALGVVVVVLVGVLARRGFAERTARLVAPLVVRVAGWLRRPTTNGVVIGHLLGFRDEVASVIGRRWWQLSVAMLGYGVLQAVLLWACLEAVGATTAVTVVLAAYAVDRIASMLVVTPGGSGFAEAGTAGALVALGGAPATMAAGVLLYRGFTFALEIPVGGIWLGGWLWTHRRRRDALRAVELAEEDAA